MSIEYVYVKKYIQQPRIVKNYPEKMSLMIFSIY